MSTPDRRPPRLVRSTRSPSRFSITLCIAAVVSLFSLSSAAADPPDAIPPNAVAWWSYDPRPLSDTAPPADPAANQLIEAALRAVVASGVINNPDAAQLTSAALAASMLGRTPHELTLVELVAPLTPHPPLDDAAPPPPLISRFACVLRIKDHSDHKPYIRTLAAILTPAPARDPASPQPTQQTLTLPDNSAAVLFRDPEWHAGLTVAWSSRPGEFVIAVGQDPAALLLAPPAASPAIAPPWTAHDAEVTRARPPGSTILRAYLDLNNLRANAPALIAVGRGPAILHALGLANARDTMFHARLLQSPDPSPDADPEAAKPPPIIAIDLTWSSRADPPGLIGRDAVSLDHWPADDLTLPPPPGSYVVVLPNRAEHWLHASLDLYAAFKTPDGSARFALSRDRWLRTNRDLLDRTLSAFSPYLVLSDVPRPAVAIPGATTLFAELRPGVNPDRVERELTRLLAPFSDHLDFSRDAQLWSLRADDQGLARLLAFGLARHRRGSVLIGGIDVALAGAWNTRVVESNRERLRTTP